MKTKRMRTVWALLLCALLLMNAALPALAYGYGVNQDGVQTMDVSSDGDNLYLRFDGDSWYIQSNMVIFNYGDGSAETYLLTAGGNGASLIDSNWATVATGSVTYTEGSQFDASLTIPLSVLHSRDFVLSMGGASVSSETLGISGGSSEPEPESTEEPADETASQPEEEPSSQPEGEPTPEPTAEPTPAPAAGNLTPTTTGNIVLDGDLSDWKAVSGVTPASTYTEVKAARDTQGNLYLALTYKAETEWDNIDWKNVTITQNGASVTGQFAALSGEGDWNIPGTYVYKNTANHNSAGPLYAEVMIPASYLTDPNFNVSVGVADFDAAEIPVVDGNDAPPEPDAVYDGIVIDGEYADWEAVTKYDATGMDEDLKYASLIFEGDYIYVYLEEQDHRQAGGAGSHNNGKFTLMTDLGNETLFTLDWDNSTVSGLEGATAAHVGARWEIAIPKSNLPAYMNTISLGLYRVGTLVANVANSDGSSGVPEGYEFSGIEYDGNYGDWAYYPHHTIQYSTAGTQENERDANGALYAAGTTLYGHVYSIMEDHTNNYKGHEFTTGVTIRFNEDTQEDFYPMLVAVDGSGNITWNPQVRDLEDGTYEFYIASIDAWHTSTNINDLIPQDTLYGKMTVTVKGGVRDECEFYLDLNKVAAKLGIPESDMKMISAQFINIGTEWISTAGSSSGPWAGIVLSLGVVGAVLGWQGYTRRKKKNEVVVG